MANYQEIIARLQAGEGDKYPEVRKDGVVIVLGMKDAALFIVALRTMSKERRKGKARLAMESLLTASDSLGIESVMLHASPMDKKTNRARLIKFYESLGFRFEGRYINMAFDPELVRRIKKD